MKVVTLTGNFQECPRVEGARPRYANTGGGSHPRGWGSDLYGEGRVSPWRVGRPSGLRGHRAIRKCPSRGWRAGAQRQAGAGSLGRAWDSTSGLQVQAECPGCHDNKENKRESLGQERPGPRAVSPSIPGKSTARTLEGGHREGAAPVTGQVTEGAAGPVTGAPSGYTLISTGAVPTGALEGARSRSDWCLSGQRGSQYRGKSCHQWAVRGLGHPHVLRTLKSANWSFLLVTRQLVVDGTKGREAGPCLRDACQGRGSSHFADEETGFWRVELECHPDRPALNDPYSP